MPSHYYYYQKGKFKINYVNIYFYLEKRQNFFEFSKKNKKSKKRQNIYLKIGL
jgi:hypothetical protein